MAGSQPRDDSQPGEDGAGRLPPLDTRERQVREPSSTVDRAHRAWRLGACAHDVQGSTRARLPCEQMPEGRDRQIRSPDRSCFRRVPPHRSRAPAARSPVPRARRCPPCWSGLETRTGSEDAIATATSWWLSVPVNTAPSHRSMSSERMGPSPTITRRWAIRDRRRRSDSGGADRGLFPSKHDRHREGRAFPRRLPTGV